MGREKNDALSQLLAKSKQLESLRQVQKQQEFEKLKHPQKQSTIKIQELQDDTKAKTDNQSKTKSDNDKHLVNTKNNTNKEIISDDVVLKSPQVNAKPSAVDAYYKTGESPKTSANDRLNQYYKQTAKDIPPEHTQPTTSETDTHARSVESQINKDSKIDDADQTVDSKATDSEHTSSDDDNVDADVKKQNFNDILANIARKARANSQKKQFKSFASN